MATFNPAQAPNFATPPNFNAGSSSFTPGVGSSAAFVPKKKQVQADPSGGSFPALGSQQATAQAAPKKEPEDYCYGKPKDFFIYDFDEATNTCFCIPEQLTFVATYYCEHYNAPIDILMWLYDMAEYRDEQAERKKIDEMYKKDTKKTGAQAQHPKKSDKKKQDEYEVDWGEEDTTFGHPNQKPKKKAPVAPPKGPAAAGGK